MRTKHVSSWRAAMFTVPRLVAVAGCAGVTTSLSGILNGSDCANGRRTVVNNEGKTLNCTVDSPQGQT